MRTQINGEERDFTDGLTLAEIMEHLGVRRGPGIAVAVNDTVVPRANHEHYRPQDGDAIEIIRAVAGG